MVRVRRWIGIAVLSALAVGALLRLSGKVHPWVLGVAREGVAPYERFIVRLVHKTDIFRSSWNTVLLASENERMRQRMQALEMEALFSRIHELENRELRRQLGFADRHPELVFAEVLSLGGSDGWSQKLRIGRGLRHGVRPNCPVLAPEGLVGRVLEATATTADVLLITDANSQVATMIEVGEWPLQGILVGGGRDLPSLMDRGFRSAVSSLRLTYLDKDVDVPEKVRVVTSGLGGVYPRGLPVGVVMNTTPDSSGLFQYAQVHPFVDFGNLRYISVLVGSARETTGGDP